MRRYNALTSKFRKFLGLYCYFTCFDGDFDKYSMLSFVISYWLSSSYKIVMLVIFRNFSYHTKRQHCYCCVMPNDINLSKEFDLVSEV